MKSIPEISEGQTYGRLTAVRRTKTRTAGNRGAFWLFKCECGTEKEIRATSVKSGNTKSCGCFHIDTARNLGYANATHGLSTTPEYRVWKAMVDRCHNPDNRHFKNYGARGITVCERWRSFDHFFKDMGQRPSPKLTLERDDNNGPYSPENCRWATRKEQINNRRNTRIIDTPWGPMSVSEAAARVGLSINLFGARVVKGWSTEDLFNPDFARKLNRHIGRFKK